VVNNDVNIGLSGTGNNNVSMWPMLHAQAYTVL